MPERRVTVASKVGLHARPAALLAKAAAERKPVRITIAKGEGQPVDAASVLGLMTLGAMHGDEVVLTAEGDGAEEALAAIAEIIATDLDEG
ncbi:HPr family phosphocarrier protein [Actinosynnema pretiosum subsp. pretiosum]|uniref:Phosphocarrier protein HPr n=2 Tax=Actinosynnema TaxID=40566 RepID=C6W910_ACTMD|nr:HPr family phosphocarrier protein [Actinosynnema mirum]ACU39082.1 Phosphotransferase system, phosphocarrier protein HPr [Actinosynnema mirum DSM 43827]AXX32678.1 Phosphotransferase system, phosphocarrier protein HPr [Actinosynnema pretiosum subsp. pretiosum]QUF03436.1 HPr family phosphocarrier protein [Actinosynnema pretiosum subsp. pretiosum]